MEEGNACQSGKWWVKYGSEIVVLRWVLTIIGICCCLQYLLFGIIGVVRGYSTHGLWSLWLLLLGIVPVFAVPRFKGLLSIPLIMVTYLIILHVLFTGQLKHMKAGHEYSRQGQYQEALREFTLASSSEAWYLRLNHRYSSFDERILLKIARTSGKLGDLDKAREVYQLLIDRYPKSKYVEDAKEALQNLE